MTLTDWMYLYRLRITEYTTAGGDKTFHTCLFHCVSVQVLQIDWMTL